MSQSFDIWFQEKKQRIEEVLNSVLPSTGIAQRLQQAMRYAVLDGGKRIRPLLVFAAGELVAAPMACLEQVAAAIELVHVYSLIHDDLPAMDNDVLRRGRATCHIQFDEATAILAGDALQSRAFDLLSAPQLGINAKQQLNLIALLSHATGAYGMCAGQTLDVEATNQTLTLPELEMLHILKTGALIRAAVLMGAHCGGELSETMCSKLTHFANCIGLAFQIVDDILDTQSSTTILGKTAGKDKHANKATYVSLLGLSEAKQKAEMLYTEALTSIADWPTPAIRLRDLAQFILKRHY